MDSDPIRKDSLNVPPATLLALAARAETGGDDALSDDVWRALGWTRDPELVVAWWAPNREFLAYNSRPNLTKSLDAVEEVPGRIVWMKRYDLYWAADAVVGMHGVISAQAPTEPLARLSAKLKALAAQKESGGG